MLQVALFIGDEKIIVRLLLVASVNVKASMMLLAVELRLAASVSSRGLTA